MSPALSRLARLIERLRYAWAETDYAQRRLLELRTGIPMSGGRPPATRAESEPAAELEELFALASYPAAEAGTPSESPALPWAMPEGTPRPCCSTLPIGPTGE
jgi:hypothetical protein